MASVDQTFSEEVAKYGSRYIFGVPREEPDSEELLKLLNKQMIIQVLGDPSCLEALTADEKAALEGTLILKS
jgi:hypothetical protein